MRRFSGYPRVFYPTPVITQSALLLTALLLIPTLFTFRLDMDSPIAVSGDLRLGSAALHTFFGMATLLITGALTSIHMRAGWVRRENRISGSVLLICLTGLSLSALGIYYFGDEQLSLWSSLAHLLLGGAWVFLLLFHGVRGYQLHRKRELQRRR